MPKTIRDLTLSSDDAFFILFRAREFDEPATPIVVDLGPLAGGEPDWDEAVEDEAAEAELARAIGRLTDDALRDLIALIWIGRGDFAVGEWNEARRAAAAVGRERAPAYIAGIPLVSDYLESGLSAFGRSLSAYVEAH